MVVRKKIFKVLNNAIEIKKFVYNSDIRAEIQTELGMKDEVLIGHIGHFSVSKNHSYLVDIFKAVHDRHPQTKLLLVSGGVLFEDVKKKVDELGLTDSVVFTGRREDTERLYQAMDIFVLPSKWEGLGMVLIEAQAADLLVLASSVVLLVAKCTENIEFYPLEKGADEWAKKVCGMAEKRTIQRGKNDMMSQISQCGYDIETEAKELEKIYLE